MMQAKLVTAAQSVKLHDWTRATLSHCLNVLRVRIPTGRNRRQARDIAMQHAFPLSAQWDAFVPNTNCVTCSIAPPRSSQSCCSQAMHDMDGLIDERDAGVLMCVCTCLLVF